MKRMLVYAAVAAALLSGCDGNGFVDTTPTPVDQQPLDSTIYIGVIYNGRHDNNSYEKCIRDAGAVPVYFEYYALDDRTAEAYVKKVDAVIVPGSTSNDTTSRTTYDRKVMHATVDAGKPLLGICFGHQKIAEMRGLSRGKVTDCFPDSQYTHRNNGEVYSHPIIIDSTSFMYDVYGTDTLMVNSLHDYCVLESSDGLGIKVVARAPDGVVEAVQGIFEGDRIYGVQYHPEILYGRYDVAEHLKIFEFLVKEAGEVKFSNK